MLSSLFGSGSHASDNDFVDGEQVREIRPALAKKWFGPRAGRMVRLGMDGTGSCFYHSLAAIMDLHGFNNASLKRRKEIVAKFRCDFKDSFDEREYAAIAGTSPSAEGYKKQKDKFCDISAWADEVLIKHASRVTGLQLLFFDLTAGKVYCGVAGEKALLGMPQKTGFIAWVKRQHFECIGRLNGVSNGEVDLTLLFDPDIPDDAAVINHVFDNYVTQCLLSKNRAGAALEEEDE